MGTLADLMRTQGEEAERQREARRRALPELAEAKAVIERMEGRKIEPVRAPYIVPEE